MSTNIIKIILSSYIFYNYKIFSCFCDSLVFTKAPRKHIFENLLKDKTIKKYIDNIEDFLEDKYSDDTNIKQSDFGSKIYDLNLNFEIKKVNKDDNDDDIRKSKPNININGKSIDNYDAKSNEKTIANNIFNYILFCNFTHSDFEFETYITKINNIPCLYFKNKNNINKRVLIFYHGNGEDIINILYHNKTLSICNILTGLENGYDVIIPELPGYTLYKSEDTTEKKFKEDTEVICNAIKNTYSKITIYGFSLGCSPAIDLASCEDSNKINMLILAHPFLNIKSAASNVCCMASAFLKQRFENNKKIKNIKCRTAILSAVNDNVVHPNDAHKLYEILKETNKNVNLYKYNSLHGLIDIRRVRKILKEDKI